MRIYCDLFFHHVNGCHQNYVRFANARSIIPFAMEVNVIYMRTHIHSNHITHKWIISIVRTLKNRSKIKITMSVYTIYLYLILYNAHSIHQNKSRLSHCHMHASTYTVRVPHRIRIIHIKNQQTNAHRINAKCSVKKRKSMPSILHCGSIGFQYLLRTI